MTLAFPKPRDVRKPKPAVKIMPDGREICTKSVLGMREWDRRRRFVWERDGKRCIKCGKPLAFKGEPPYLPEMTADHKIPRGLGGATRDDRVDNLRCMCFECNSRKGSRRI